MKKIELFKIEGDKINRIRRHCPKCGPGVFIAEHKNRFSCGRCGYTEFKSGGRKEPSSQKVEEKPVEAPELSKEEVSVQKPESSLGEESKTETKDTRSEASVEDSSKVEERSKEPGEKAVEEKPAEKSKADEGESKKSS